MPKATGSACGVLWNEADVGLSLGKCPEGCFVGAIIDKETPMVVTVCQNVAGTNSRGCGT